jgi:hypothetical protein
MSADFYYTRDGKRYGPVAPAELKRLAATGGLKPSDKIRKGEGGWVAAGTVKGLFPEPGRACSPPPAPEPEYAELDDPEYAELDEDEAEVDEDAPARRQAKVEGWRKGENGWERVLPEEDVTPAGPQVRPPKGPDLARRWKALPRGVKVSAAAAAAVVGVGFVWWAVGGRTVLVARSGDVEVAVRDATAGRVTVLTSEGSYIGGRLMAAWEEEKSTSVDTLNITLAVRNCGSAPLKYNHPRTCRLSDEKGNRFKALNEARKDLKVKGQLESAAVPVGGAVTDIFLFSKDNLGKGSYLILELPGDAFGSAGAVELRIAQKDVAR